MATTVKSAARRAIERLHRRDMRASKDGDFETLRSLVGEPVEASANSICTSRARMSLVLAL